jgi:oligopeptide transport system ATP-binding protein
MVGRLLEVEDLRVGFQSEAGMAEAIRGVTFGMDQREAIGIVGESGSGKSLTAISILQLLAPPARILGGSIRFAGKNLIGLPAAELGELRGRDISIVFQDPSTSLNPVFSIGTQLVDVIRSHQGLGRSAATSAAAAVLASVGISQPEARLNNYPHELSGGMRQRVMIGMAVACRPRLLILDEPTTALDVTVQAQVMEVIRGLKDELGLAVLFITHNLDLAAEFCDRLIVMYAGEIVEEGSTVAVFSEPRHPYTRALLDCIPQLSAEQRPLGAIPGQPPVPGDRIPGCGFAGRCSQAGERCFQEKPRLEEAGDGIRVACFAVFGSVRSTRRGSDG